MNIIIALLIGALGGLTAALCGVGGGLIMVPAFVLALGLDQKHAVATSLAVIIPTAFAATAQYARAGLVDWKIVLPTAIGAVLVAYFATDWMKSLSNVVLTRVFAVVLIGVGLRMLLIRP
jgi:uncharacterized membrane protein YfcA